MTECKKCGGKDWAVITTLGALETWRCEACGDTVTFHVNHPLFPNGLPPDLEVSLPVVARWISKPTTQKISELKNLIPKLKAISGISFFQNALNDSTFDLGSLTKSELHDYEPKFQALGLEVRFKGQ